VKRFEIMEGPLEGAHLLEASAGTGKTYTIADLYLRLILEKGLTVDRVLVVTFTNAATGELRERLRSRLKGAVMALSGGPPDDAMPRELYEKFQGPEREAALVRLRRALNFFDAAAVYTIHGFCRRVLLENAFESGHLFDTDLVSDQSALLAEVVEDFWRRRFYGIRPSLYRYGGKALTPAGLAAAAVRMIDNPGIQVVPPPGEVDEEALDGKLAGFYALFDEIRALWVKEKAEIQALIVSMIERGVLGGRSYRMDDAIKRPDTMDAFLGKGDPAEQFEQLKFYTRSKLMREAREPEEVSHHLFFQLCENFSQLRERLPNDFNEFLINLKYELFNYAAAELDERKRAKNVRSFGDMLANLHGALEGPGGESLAAALRRSFPAALIDEFQDTDTLQYEIFTRIFNRPGGLLYLIGDPKQAIYRFRGADIYAYMEAARGTASRATLGRNWRSSPGLVRAVNTVFSRGKNPFVFDENLIGFTEVEPASREAPAFNCHSLDGAPLQIWYLPPSLAASKTGRLGVGQAESLTAGATAGEIARILALGREGKALIGEKPLAAGDIAVLVRKKAQAELVRDELLALGVPGVLYGGGSVFASREAEQLRRVLEAVAAGGRGRALRAALGTDMCGWTAGRIYNLNENEQQLEETAARFAGYRDRWLENGFMYMFRGLVEGENVYENLLGRSGGERSMTNLLHLAELLHRREADEGSGMEGLIAWMAERRENPEGKNDEEETRLETDDDTVKLITLHRAKGLQYPVVFCPYLWGEARADKEDITFHRGDGGKSSGLTLDIGSAEIDEHRKKALLEDLAESVRLMYVGLTRAQCRCYLAWGAINNSELSAPAYVFHRPPDMDQDSVMDLLPAHVKKMDDNRMRAELSALERASGGSVKVADIPLEETAPAPATSAVTPALSYRPFNGEIKRDWSISSYTSLAAGAPHGEEARDHDAGGFDGPPAAADTADRGIFGFPAGAASGIFMHDIFEKLDFAADEELVAALVKEKAGRYGIDPAWEDTIIAMVLRVLETPLDRGAGFRLKDLGMADRINELEFYFPMNTAIEPAGLGAVFARFGLSAANGYGRSLERLNFSPRRGFMRGFIDMVFRREGRYYLLDWKSNLLGRQKGDYGLENLRRAMAQHHYDLQYHLYTVALHRYLQTRLRDYRYDGHFGGVYYLFLRGVEADEAETRGVYFDRPSGELVEALSLYLGGEGR